MFSSRSNFQGSTINRSPIPREWVFANSAERVFSIFSNIYIFFPVYKTILQISTQNESRTVAKNNNLVRK